MKHVKTLNTNTLKNTMRKGGCGECQNILPVRMQDILYSRKPELREQGPLVFQAERIPFLS